MSLISNSSFYEELFTELFENADIDAQYWGDLQEYEQRMLEEEAISTDLVPAHANY